MSTDAAQLSPASMCGVRKPSFPTPSSKASDGAGRVHLREHSAGKHYIFQSSELEDLSAPVGAGESGLRHHRACGEQHMRQIFIFPDDSRISVAINLIRGETTHTPEETDSRNIACFASGQLVLAGTQGLTE